MDLWGRDVDAIADPRVRSAGVADHRPKSNEARAVASMHMWLTAPKIPTSVMLASSKMFFSPVSRKDLGVTLGQYGLAIDGCHGSNDLRAVRAGRERCICETGGLVAEVDDQVLSVPRGGEDTLRIRDGLVQVLQW